MASSSKSLNPTAARLRRGGGIACENSLGWMTGRTEGGQLVAVAGSATAHRVETDFTVCSARYESGDERLRILRIKVNQRWSTRRAR